MKRMRIFMLLIVVLFLFATSFVATTIAKYVKEENTATFNLTVRADGKIDLALTDGLATPPETDKEWKAHNIPVIPGTIADFNPYVRVGAGSEPAYLFVEVTKEASEGYTFEELITLGINSAWRILEKSEDGKTTVYYWEGDVAKSDEAQYFPITPDGIVSFSESITEEDLGNLHTKGFPKVTIKAYAVQKTKLDEGNPAIEGAKEETPAAAWEYLQS